MRRNTILVLALVAKGARGQYYQCFVDGGGYIGYTPVDISHACCSDTMNLYDADNAALEKDLEECANEFEYSLMNNPYDYCSVYSDAAMTCTFDYDTFSCDDDFKRLCGTQGGRVVEADLRLRCFIDGIDLTLEFLSKVDCVASSCSDAELMEVYRTVLSEMGCTVTRTSNVRVDGELRAGLSFSSGGGGSSDKGSVGLIVGCVVGGLVALIGIVLLVVCLTRKKNQDKNAAEAGSNARASPEQKASIVPNDVQMGGKGTTETRYEVINPDGSMTVSSVRQNPDGSKTITETTIPASSACQGMQNYGWQ